MIERDITMLVEDRQTRAKPLVEHRCVVCGKASLQHEGERPRCYYHPKRTMTAGTAQVMARRAMRHG